MNLTKEEQELVMLLRGKIGMWEEWIIKGSLNMAAYEAIDIEIAARKLCSLTHRKIEEKNSESNPDLRNKDRG